MVNHMRAAFVIVLVMSLDMHVMSARSYELGKCLHTEGSRNMEFGMATSPKDDTPPPDDTVEEEGNFDWSSTIPSHSNQPGGEQEEKEKPSVLCAKVKRAAELLKTQKTRLGHLLDLNSATTITHLTTHILPFLRGYGVDTVASYIKSDLGDYPMFIGTLFTFVDMLNHNCKSTLGTCVGINSVLGLLISAILIIKLLFPLFLAALAAKVGLAASSAFLSTNLGKLFVALATLVRRKIAGYVCDVIKDGYIKASLIMPKLRDLITDILKVIKEESLGEASAEQILEVINDMIREKFGEEIDEVVAVMTRACEEKLMALSEFAEFQQLSWEVAMGGMRSNNENRVPIVNASELVVGAGNREGLGLNRWEESIRLAMGREEINKSFPRVGARGHDHPRSQKRELGAEFLFGLPDRQSSHLVPQATYPYQIFNESSGDAAPI